VNDILDLTRLQSSQLKIEPKNFKLLTIVDNSLELISGIAANKGINHIEHITNECVQNCTLLLEIEIDCSIPQSVPNVLFADPGRMQQILINLLGNALKVP